MTAALEAAGNNPTSDAALVNVEKAPQEPGIFYLQMKYKIKDLDVFETAHIPNSFEQLGNSFLKLIAKIFLRITNERQVNIGPVEIALPDLHLDYQIIRSIKITRVHLEYNKALDEATNGKADFSFLKTFSISNTAGERLLSYQNNLNQCQMKCLDFIIENGNILPLIKNIDNVKLNPALSISSLPNINELRLDGDVDLKIGLQLPF